MRCEDDDPLELFLSRAPRTYLFDPPIRWHWGLEMHVTTIDMREAVDSIQPHTQQRTGSLGVYMNMTTFKREYPPYEINKALTVRADS